MPLPRMRTAQGVLDAIKAEDPNTEVTMYYIRYLIHANKVPVVNVGRKKLVNVDAIIALLAQDVPAQEKPEEEIVPGIRRVQV